MKRRKHRDFKIEAHPTGNVSTIPPSQDEIRQRANEIYIARGGKPGKELDDWLLAEAELKQQGRSIKDASTM